MDKSQSKKEVQAKKNIDNLRKMVAEKEILFYHPSIQQALEDHITHNTDEEELEDYMNNLITRKLVKMNYTPNKISLQCDDFENRYNQLKKLHDNNPNIKHLTIDACNINIVNMKLISNFINLEELYLGSTGLHTKSGFYIKKLNKLTTLKIPDNPHLKLVDYKNITSMKTITHLDLSSNPLNNAKIFKLIGNMNQLKVLNLSDTINKDNYNESYYATAIKNLPKLKVLNLSECKLKGSCLSNLQTRSLSELYLNKNEIDYEGIIKISKIESLRVLNLPQNRLGSRNINIKPLFEMKQLKVLGLSQNSLTNDDIIDIDKLANTNIILYNNLISVV